MQKVYPNEQKAKEYEKLFKIDYNRNNNICFSDEFCLLQIVKAK